VREEVDVSTFGHEFFGRECVNCRVPAKIVAAGLCQRCVDARREADRLANDMETLKIEGAIEEGQRAAPLREEPSSWL
jgi:hypothetical protein